MEVSDEQAPHHPPALRYVAANPGAHADLRAVGTRTALSLEAAGLATTTVSVRRENVPNGAWTSRKGGNGYHSVTTVEIVARATEKGLALLAVLA